MKRVLGIKATNSFWALTWRQPKNQIPSLNRSSLNRKVREEQFYERLWDLREWRCVCARVVMFRAFARFHFFALMSTAGKFYTPMNFRKWHPVVSNASPHQMVHSNLFCNIVALSKVVRDFVLMWNKHVAIRSHFWMSARPETTV